MAYRGVGEELPDDNVRVTKNSSAQKQIPYIRLASYSKANDFTGSIDGHAGDAIWVPEEKSIKCTKPTRAHLGHEAFREGYHVTLSHSG
jgi:hypothetical protein